MWLTVGRLGKLASPQNRLVLLQYIQQLYSSPIRDLSTHLVKQNRHQFKQLDNVKLCSWCKNHHKQLSNFVTETKDSRYFGLTNSSVKNNLLQTLYVGRRTLLDHVMIGVQSKGFITHQQTHCIQIRSFATVHKVPLAKAAPLRRIGRKKLQVELEESIHHRNVVAYAVGEEMNLSSLRAEISKQGVYDIVDLPRDITDVLMVTARYKVENQAREAFFFSDGGVAFWHMSESERHDLWKLARTFALNPYNHHLIIEENESLSVVYDSATRLVGDTIHLKTATEDKAFDEETTLHKYTFSNALSQSVNLAISEAYLERFIDLLEPETQKLRDGGKSRMKKKEINMKLGEVFQLRHEVNLESGYLDDPDIYWEREELEGLYRQMISYLSMPKRIKVLNERLNYCSEILQLLNSQQNDTHHVRLEWIIIILIMIEVVFEAMHYAEKYGYIKGPSASTTSTARPDRDWYTGPSFNPNISYNASMYTPPWTSEADKAKDKSKD